MLEFCIHDCYHYNVMTVGVLVCEGLAVCVIFSLYTLIFKAGLSYISLSTSSQMTPCKNQQTKSMPVPIKLRAATPRAEAHINWLNDNSIDAV